MIVGVATNFEVLIYSACDELQWRYGQGGSAMGIEHITLLLAPQRNARDPADL